MVKRRWEEWERIERTEITEKKQRENTCVCGGVKRRRGEGGWEARAWARVEGEAGKRCADSDQQRGEVISSGHTTNYSELSTK